jgi:predicted alpha/beta superfamily hydrolase
MCLNHRLFVTLKSVSLAAQFYRMPTEPIARNDSDRSPGGGNRANGELDSLASRLRKHERFASKIVEERHDFLVYLPPAYDVDTSRRFPVLYMQDGQNLFDPATSFVPGADWRLGETADARISSGAIAPLIIVGIYNTGDHRIEEYTPVKDARRGGGQADAYGRMLVEELKPLIDQQYRTSEGAGNCGLGGSSLGGLVSLHLGLRYPNVFGKIAAMSPSIWWRDRDILKTVAQLSKKPDLRIWLDIGTCESRCAVPDARTLRDSLLTKGWRIGQDLAYMEAKGAQHNEVAWAERVAPMLEFLFPAEG